MYKDFSYIADENSKILILGTFPSKVSREVTQYYGNMHNQFWKILFEIFNTNYSNDTVYNDKVNFLLQHNIALWDIIAKCDTDGSLDSRIKNAVYNDINEFLKRHENVNAIFCNGQMAYKQVMKTVDSNKFNVILLPSTSPTNTVKYGIKYNIWKREIEKYLKN